MKIHAFALAILCAMAAPVGAAEEESSRFDVYVSNQCADDTIGQRLTYSVKEGLNRSTTMVSGEQNESLFHLRLICLSPDASDRGNWSHYAYEITLLNTKGYYDFALTFGVGRCGSSRVAECAEGLVATIDGAISELRKHIADGSFAIPH